jgi:hypothetical protein
VRRAENRSLASDGDTRLIGTKHLWLFAEANIPYALHEGVGRSGWV